MNRNEKAPPRPPSSTGFDWRRLACAVCLQVEWAAVAQSVLSPDLARVVGNSMHAIGRSLDAQLHAEEEAPASPAVTAASIVADLNASEPPPRVVVPLDEEAARAAAALGVDASASEEEIRRALRVHMRSSAIHPDHGGDLDRAKELIAAQNLLLERAKARRV